MLIGTPILTGSLIRLILGIWTDQYGGCIVYVGVMVSAAIATFLLTFHDQRCGGGDPAEPGRARRPRAGHDGEAAAGANRGMASVTVVLPMTIRRRGGRKQIIGPDGAPVRAGEDGAGVASMTETRGDPALLKALARAFRWRRMLEEGRYGSISELAAAEEVDRGYLGRVLRLTLLAPDLVEAILSGQPINLELPPTQLPYDWQTQRDTAGLAAPPHRAGQT